MEAGLSKHWTPEQEDYWTRKLSECHTFAKRHLGTILRNLFKYDGRTKQAKKANAQARLQLITATDADLEELANLTASICGTPAPEQVAQHLEDLKKRREALREKGIKRSDLECT